MLTKYEIEEDEYLASKNGYKIKKTEISINYPPYTGEIEYIIRATPIFSYNIVRDAMGRVSI